MSYSIRLVNDGSEKAKIKKALTTEIPKGPTFRVVEYPRQIIESDLFLNVTYNHAKYFYQTLDPEKGIRWIYGQKARTVIPQLESAVKWLESIAEKEESESTIKINKNDIYYPCAFNAANVLRDLIRLGQLAPDFIFEGD